MSKTFLFQAIQFSQTVLIQTNQFSISTNGYDMFPDFFRMGTFIDNTHMKL